MLPIFYFTAQAFFVRDLLKIEQERGGQLVFFNSDQGIVNDGYQRVQRLW